MRSGTIDLNHGLLRDIGFVGYDWLSLIGAYFNTNTAAAYALLFNTSDLVPSNGPYTRIQGFPVRCLASGALVT